MQRIRIKTAPKLGDQVDYSFYDSRYRNAGMGGSAEDEVKTTMGPVPRKEASIEVERGEVVVGDTNTDGFLELFTFTGKPHSKGGTPVDVPAGSFIYSNTRKLRIKDEELLKKVFGLNPKKGGYTPAEIAKMYQVNQYVADLKNPEADNITKRSANEMLKNNLQKLSTLALVQESMKGFPDGIPAIAEMAANALGVTPEMFQQPQGGEQMAQEQMSPEQMPMARRGGLKKYQSAGETQKVRPTGDQIAMTPATIVYINGKPHRYLAGESQINTLSPNQYVFQDAQTGNKFYIDEHAFNRSYNTSVPHDRMYGDQYLHYYIGESNEPFVGDDWYKYNYGVDIAGTKLNKGDLFFKGNDMYRVEWPYAARKYQNHPHTSPSVKAIKVTPVYDATGTKIVSYNPVYGEHVENIFQQDLLTAAENRQFAKVDLSQSNQQPYQSQQSGAADVNRAGTNNAPVLYDPNTTQQPVQQQQQQQPAQQQQQRTARPAAPARSTRTPEHAPLTESDFEFGGALPYYMTSFEYGGSYAADGLPIHQIKGPVEEENMGPGKKPNTTKYKQANGDIYLRDNTSGKVVGIMHADKSISTYFDDRVERRDAKGNIIGVDVPDANQPYADANWKGEYMDDVEQFEKIFAGPNSEKLKDAMYAEFKKIAAASNDKSLSAMGRDEALKFMIEGNRQNAMIQSAYAGNDAFLKSPYWDKGKSQDYTDAQGNKVSGRNLYYNRTAQKLGLNPLNDTQIKAFQAMYQAAQRVARQPEYMEQFRDFDINPVGLNDQQTMGEAVTPVDGIAGNTNVGQLTRLKAKPEIPEKPKETPDPGMEKAYYCVESADGSRAVQTVEYAKGSQPTAPSGTKVTPYNSIEEAQAGCQTYDQGFPPPGKRKEGPWWAQDIVNFAFESTRDIERFKPAKQQVDFVTPEWTTISNAATIANAQGNARMFSDMAQNSADGNVAIASTLGNTGETLQALALSDAQTNTVNAQTSTQAGQFNAQIENTERDLNPKYNRQYMVDLATEGQNFENAQNLQDRNVKRALIAGMTNWGDKKWIEAGNRQVYINPINFDVEFSGEGRDVMGPDTYMPSYGGPTARGVGRRSTSNAFATASAMNSDAGIRAYRDTYERLKVELGEDAARQAALGEMNRVNALLRSNPQAAMYTSGDDVDGFRNGGFIQYGTGGAIVTPEEMFKILIKRKTGR